MATDTKPGGGSAHGEGAQPTAMREVGGMAMREVGDGHHDRRDIRPAVALPPEVLDGPVESGVVLADLGGIVRFCSESVARLAAMPVGALRGKPIPEVLPGLSLRAQTPGYNLVFAALRDGEQPRRHVGLLRADGIVTPVETSLSTVVLQGERLIVVELAWRLPESESLQALRRLAWVGERSAESVMVTDGDGVIEYVNPVFESITGYANGEVVGRTAAVLKSDTHDGEFFRALWRTILAGQPFHAVFVNRGKHGRLFHEDKSIAPVVDSQGRILHFLSTGRDVSDWVRSKEQLEYRASHDLLTDLPGRSLFFDRLEHTLAYSARRGEGFTVAYLDVDRFKSINDSFGHAAGDGVLKEVAYRLNRCVRAEDTVARLSGDEFAIVLTGVGRPDAARSVLKKIVAEFKPALRIAERIVPVTVSVGACLYPADGKDAETLLRCADGTMYRAKSAGGNCWRLFSADEIDAASRNGSRGARAATASIACRRR
jgi:diguanylate cyclase (GGDEF)-like protein/PAS domain S-box-containing protein